MKIRQQLWPLFAISILLCGCMGVPLMGDSEPVNSTISAAKNENEPATETTSSPISLCIAGTEQGYYRSDIYFEDGANITYIDYQTKAEVFLCSSPNCSHQDDTCPSFYPFEGATQLSGVQVAGEHLLALQSFASAQEVPHIDLLTFDGMFQKRLVEFDSTQKLPGKMQRSYYTDGDFLYFILSDVDSNTAQTKQSIIRVSLENGTVQTLYTPSDEVLFLALCGSYDRTLIYRETIPQGGKKTVDYYWKLDADSGLTTKLPYIASEELGVEIRGETVYGMDFSDCSITVHNLITEEEKQAVFSELNTEVIEKYGNHVMSSVAPSIVYNGFMHNTVFYIRFTGGSISSGVCAGYKDRLCYPLSPF